MYTTAFATFGAIVLTPIAMRVLAHTFPARSDGAAEYETLRPQYRRLELASQLAAVGGLLVCSALLIVLRVGNSPWIVGAAFGWLVLAPVLLIAATTLPRGLTCWREFWRFYELTYHVSLRFLAPVYCGLCVLGVISTFALLSRK